jgi:hypothetical protein
MSVSVGAGTLGGESAWWGWGMRGSESAVVVKAMDRRGACA